MLQLQKEDQQKGWKTWIGKYRFWFRGVQRANLALTHYKLLEVGATMWPH